MRSFRKVIAFLMFLTLLTESLTVYASSSNILGDVDGDGFITSSDALHASRICVGSEDYSRLADINNNGFITSSDALKILRYSIGLIDDVKIGRDVNEKFTVSFDSAGGSLIEDQILSYGDCAVEPIVPIRDGYVFDGWYNGDDVYDFSNIVTDNLTLISRWVSRDFNLTADKYVFSSGDMVKLSVKAFENASDVYVEYVCGSESGVLPTINDGFDVDKVANDDVYTATFDLAIPDDTCVTFSASVDGVPTNSIDVNWYAPASDDIKSKMDVVITTFKNLIASDEFQNMSLPERKHKVMVLLKRFERMGYVEENSIVYNDGIVSFDYKGLGHGFVPLMLFDNDKMGLDWSDAAVSSYSGEYISHYDYYNHDDEMPVSDGTFKCFGNAIILDSTESVAASGDGDSFSICNQKLMSCLIENGLNTTIVHDPTIRDYENLHNYNVINFSAHGSYEKLPHGNFPGICLEISEEDYMDDIEHYTMLIKADDIGVSPVFTVDHEMVRDKYCVAVYPKFFRDYYSPIAFSDTFILVGSCSNAGNGHGADSIYYDYSMPNAFLKCGAASCLNFHNNVYCDYSTNVFCKYITALGDGSTSREAYNVLKEQHLLDYKDYLDSMYSWSDYLNRLSRENKIFRPEYDVAYLVYSGCPDVKLPTLALNSFENNFGSAPMGWTCNGDVFVTPKFLDVEPYDGEGMVALRNGDKLKKSSEVDRRYTTIKGAAISKVIYVPYEAQALRFRYNYVTDFPEKAVQFTVTLKDLNGNVLYTPTVNGGSVCMSDSYYISHRYVRYQWDELKSWYLDEKYFAKQWLPANDWANGTYAHYLPNLDSSRFGLAFYQTGWHTGEIDLRHFAGSNIVVEFQRCNVVNGRFDGNLNYWQSNILLLDDISLTKGFVVNPDLVGLQPVA